MATFAEAEKPSPEARGLQGVLQGVLHTFPVRARSLRASTGPRSSEEPPNVMLRVSTDRGHGRTSKHPRHSQQCPR